MTYKGAQTRWPRERAVRGSGDERRAVIVEPHPAVRAVIEHLLLREGYLVEVREESAANSPPPASGPALLLVSLQAHAGLYVLKSLEPAETLESLASGGETAFPAAATGMHAHLPRPFGVEDVLRAVRAVSGFDGRRKSTAGLR